VQEISYRVALEVAIEARRRGLAEVPEADNLEQRIRDEMWSPQYEPLV
jgi:malic enzyme